MELAPTVMVSRSPVWVTEVLRRQSPELDTEEELPPLLEQPVNAPRASTRARAKANFFFF